MNNLEEIISSFDHFPSTPESDKLFRRVERVLRQNFSEVKPVENVILEDEMDTLELDITWGDISLTFAGNDVYYISGKDYGECQGGLIPDHLKKMVAPLVN